MYEWDEEYFLLKNGYGWKYVHDLQEIRYNKKFIHTKSASTYNLWTIKEHRLHE